MYIAILVMLCGIVFGRLARNIKILDHLDKLVLPAILLLLFLLGAAIGKDSKIMENMGALGLEALALTIFGMAGSIFCVKLFSASFVGKIWARGRKSQ